MEQNEAADSEARDVNAPWLDPMAQPNDRQFASDIKINQMGQKGTELPAWKAANKVSSYGKITSLSIQDQRKSLPIYKLREQLVQAVRDVGPPSQRPHRCHSTEVTESNPGCGRRYWVGQNHSNGSVPRRRGSS